MEVRPVANVSEKNGKMGVSGRICLYVACYDFQCFFLIFDALCGGGFGTILPLTFTVDVWIEWG